MDTNSFIVDVKTDEIYEEIVENVTLMKQADHGLKEKMKK